MERAARRHLEVSVLVLTFLLNMLLRPGEACLSGAARPVVLWTFWARPRRCSSLVHGIEDACSAAQVSPWACVNLLRGRRCLLAGLHHVESGEGHSGPELDPGHAACCHHLGSRMAASPEVRAAFATTKCSRLLPPTREHALYCRVRPRCTGSDGRGLGPPAIYLLSIIGWAFLQCEWPGRPLTGSILLPSLSVVAITVADGIGWCGSTFPTSISLSLWPSGPSPIAWWVAMSSGCRSTYVAGPCLAFPWLWGVLSHVWTRGWGLVGCRWPVDGCGHSRKHPFANKLSKAYPHAYTLRCVV
jgi:hypothetical protein